MTLSGVRGERERERERERGREGGRDGRMDGRTEGGTEGGREGETDREACLGSYDPSLKYITNILSLPQPCCWMH